MSLLFDLSSKNLPTFLINTKFSLQWIFVFGCESPKISFKCSTLHDQAPICNQWNTALPRCLGWYSDSSVAVSSIDLSSILDDQELMPSIQILLIRCFTGWMTAQCIFCKARVCICNRSNDDLPWYWSDSDRHTSF